MNRYARIVAGGIVGWGCAGLAAAGPDPNDAFLSASAETFFFDPNNNVADFASGHLGPFTVEAQGFEGITSGTARTSSDFGRFMLSGEVLSCCDFADRVFVQSQGSWFDPLRVDGFSGTAQLTASFHVTGTLNQQGVSEAGAGSGADAEVGLFDPNGDPNGFSFDEGFWGTHDLEPQVDIDAPLAVAVDVTPGSVVQLYATASASQSHIGDYRLTLRLTSLRLTQGGLPVDGGIVSACSGTAYGATPGDIDGDGDVDLDDLLLVLGNFNAGPGGDADGDGDTDLDDLLIVLGNFGT